MRRRPDPPIPQAIDPASGFKVPHSNLVRQYDGEYVDRRFVDKRNPQDLVRARRESPSIPHPRPEPSDRFVAVPILWEDLRPMLSEDGGAILSEGVIPTMP